MGFARIFAHIYKECSNWVAKRQYGKTPHPICIKTFYFLNGFNNSARYRGAPSIQKKNAELCNRNLNN